jgi:hypothetical protein
VEHGVESELPLGEGGRGAGDIVGERPREGDALAVTVRDDFVSEAHGRDGDHTLWVNENNVSKGRVGTWAREMVGRRKRVVVVARAQRVTL